MCWRTCCGAKQQGSTRGLRDRDRHSARTVNLLQQLRGERGPARLMARAETRAVLAVEIFEEEYEIAPVRIALKPIVVSVHRPRAGRILQEDVRKPPRQFRRDFTERQQLARSGRALYLEVVAIITMKPLKRLDDQIVEIGRA